MMSGTSDVDDAASTTETTERIPSPSPSPRVNGDNDNVNDAVSKTEMNKHVPLPSPLPSLLTWQNFSIYCCQRSVGGSDLVVPGNLSAQVIFLQSVCTVDLLAVII
jgi:hypothetical protein